MSTRSIIAVPKGNGKYLAVYCHYDGYPDYVGKMLTENYSDYDKALQLVKHGNISSLAEDIQKVEGHSFENRVEGQTVFYGRDRGEKNQEAKEVDYFDIQRLDMGQEYIYIFDQGDEAYGVSDKWNCLDVCHYIDLYKKEI